MSFLEWEVVAAPDHVIGGDHVTSDVGVDQNLDHQEDLDREVEVDHLQGGEEIREILEVILDRDIMMIDGEVIIIEDHNEDKDNLKKNNHRDHQIDHFLFDQ